VKNTKLSISIVSCYVENRGIPADSFPSHYSLGLSSVKKRTIYQSMEYTKEALVDGTRMRIKFMHRNAIDSEVLAGTARNKRILIPRIHLTYSATIFIRKNCYFIEAVSFYTWSIVHTSLQVVRSLDGFRFYIFEYNGQGHLANDENVFTQKKTIVYTDVLFQ
jgi:hypothetical protein